MRSLRFLLLSSALVWIANAAIAVPVTVNYTDVLTPAFNYTGIQETFDESEYVPGFVLFGQPIAAGNSISFSPPNFVAEANPGTSFESDQSLLEFMIEATPGNLIDQIVITEFGDAVLLGGSFGTNTFVNMAGFITVVETTAGSIDPVTFGFTGTFDPSNALNSPTNPGTTLWTAQADLDVVALASAEAGEPIENITKVLVSMDNDLFALSDGGIAKIQKKVANGVTVTVPEPGLLVLLGAGLLGLGLRRKA